MVISVIGSARKNAASSCRSFSAGSGGGAGGAIFIEAEPPHCVRVVTLNEEDLVAGERANRLALKRFANCLERWRKTEDDFVWWGPGGDRADAETIHLPDWYKEQLEDTLAYFEQEEQAYA